MNTKQAREVMNALEAIFRWKLKQPNIMREYLPDRLDWVNDFDASLAKRKGAEDLLKAANDLLIPYDFGDSKPLKDEQWHRIFNIYQTIRHAIQQAEYPDSKGVDSYPVYPSGNEPLPGIEWREKGEKNHDKSGSKSGCGKGKADAGSEEDHL
jgi:hypothetical protein